MKLWAKRRKYYTIFINNDTGRHIAVPYGWSWHGFFCGPTWLLCNDASPVLATIFSLPYFMLAVIGLPWYAAIIIGSALCGWLTNEVLREYLPSKGYEAFGTFVATSRADAISQHIKAMRRYGSVARERKVVSIRSAR